MGINSGFKIISSIEGLRISRKLPVNVTEADVSLFRRILNADIESIEVAEMENMNLISQGVIFRGLTVLKKTGYSNDDGEIVPYFLKDLLKIKLLWKRVGFEKGPKYLSIDHIYTHTYYHWLTEALPRLYLIKEHIQNSILLLPENHKQRFHLESLQLFGVVEIKWLKKGINYRVPKIITSTHVGRHANYNPLVIKAMSAFIKSRIDCSLDRGKRIYVKRQGALRRKIVNDLEVEHVLTDAGFRVLDFEAYSFTEQVSIMHQCKYLVSIHGAGLANMIFMPPGGAVLELRKFDNGLNYAYYTLANTSDLDYLYQFCDSPDSMSVQDSDIIVDVDKLKLNVEKMLKL